MFVIVAIAISWKIVENRFNLLYKAISKIVIRTKLSTDTREYTHRVSAQSENRLSPNQTEEREHFTGLYDTFQSNEIENKNRTFRKYRTKSRERKKKLSPIDSTLLLFFFHFE